MQADWSRLKRLGLVLFAVSAAGLSPVMTESARADDDDEEDEDEDEDEGEDEEGGEEEEEEDGEAQPPVTAGGLYTKETYPISEIERPLTITRKMTELRFGIDINMSATRAFKDFGIGLDVRHGLEDNVELQAGFRSDLNNFDGLNFYAAFEGSIVYDLVDFRAGIAIPHTKTTTTTTVGDPPVTTVTTASATGFDFEIGFPFRFAPKPQVAIIALDTFMTINTRGDEYTVMVGEEVVKINSKTPDLTPSVGIIVQPIPILAIKLQAKLIIKDFNTDADNFQIPVSANIQFSPKNLIDIGGEFTFPNLKPPDPDGMGALKAPAFYDSRFLLLYGQLRF